jgi:hypothetical protein
MGAREPDAGSHSVHTYGVLHRFVGPRTGVVAGVVVSWDNVKKLELMMIRRCIQRGPSVTCCGDVPFRIEKRYDHDIPYANGASHIFSLRALVSEGKILLFINATGFPNVCSALVPTLVESKL